MRILVALAVLGAGVAAADEPPVPIPVPVPAFSFAKHAGHPALPDVRRCLAASLGADAKGHAAAVRALQARGPKVVEILADEYRTLPAPRAFDRWLLVHTLGDARHPASLSFLRALLRDPLPP